MFAPNRQLLRWCGWLSMVMLLASCGAAGQAPQNMAAGATPIANATSVLVGGSVVARLDTNVLTRGQLDQEIARIRQGMQAQPRQGQPPTAREIERKLVTQFIDLHITLNLARQQNIAITDDEIDQAIGRFRAQFGQNGGTLDQMVQYQLGFPGEASAEFREFTASVVARQQLGLTLVPTDTVRQAVTDQIMAQVRTKVDQVHVAQIVVKTEAEAKQVIDRLAKGEQFADLAKQLSQDASSAGQGGDLGWIQQGQMLPEFEKAVFQDLRPGETTSTPVQTRYGYHVIKVIERAVRPILTEDQAQQQIAQRVPQELSRLRQQALQKLITDERARAKAAGHLEEPTYPDLTPSPAARPQPVAPTATP
jgi:parvulin-like peptidyl-prolyl isomerase